jgi:hypothetical protein
MLETCFNETYLKVVLGTGVEVIENSPHRCSGRHPIDALANGSRPQSTPGLLLEPLHP